MDLRNSPDIILHVLTIVKNECPNNDLGGLCKNYDNCLDCWYQYLIRMMKTQEK